MIEYLNTIYVLSLISTIIGIIIIYIYDKFEKKQYTSAIYIRIALLIYISTFGTIHISKHLSFNTNTQLGGSVNPQSLMPQGNDLLKHLEQFNTGIPTF